MKTTIAILFFLLCSSMTMGQELSKRYKKETKRFMRELINNEKKEFPGKISVAEIPKNDLDELKISITEIEQTKKNLKYYRRELRLRDTGELIDRSYVIKTDSLELKPIDGKGLMATFSSYKGVRWSNEMLGDSTKILSKVTVDQIHDGTNYPNNGLYSFSSPLFLKKYHVCIVYISCVRASLNGEGSVRIYKKVNGRWRQMDPLYMWVS